MLACTPEDSERQELRAVTGIERMPERRIGMGGRHDGIVVYTYVAGQGVNVLDQGGMVVTKDVIIIRT